MKNLHAHAVSLTALAAALFAAFGPARAEEADEVIQLTKPRSEISIGLGYVDSDNKRFGEYTGRNEDGLYGLLDVDMVRRDDATGTWLKIIGRNLGLDSREIRFEHNRQGSWGYFLEYSATPRFDPLTVITRTSGIGTARQDLTGLAAPANVQLDTKREAITFGFSKLLGKGFDFKANFRTEDKDGARRWGRQGPDFLAEPIDYTTNQWEAIFGYTGERLQLSAGYYGTSFDNAKSKVDVLLGGVLAGGNNPISLPPDNESHQLFLSGGYSFTPATRGTFKLSHTEVTQNETFFTAPTLAGNTRTGLDGKVSTTLAQLGIVSSPLPKLTLRADLRYEDRNDKTPRVQFITATGSRDGFNVPLPRTTTLGKLEASYRLPMSFRITGGLDYDRRDRQVTPTLRQASWREQTEEISYRVELRRSLSETLNGALSYVRSERNGSAYLAANNAPASDVIDPIHWADRDRDKWRLRLDWAPLKPLSVQFTADYAHDTYDGRALGPESGKFEFYGVDASYVISDKWQAIGWLSRGENRVNQSTISSAAETWRARLRNTSDSIGVGLRGKPVGKIEIGADLQFQEDKDKYSLIASTGSLPDVNYKHTVLNLFAKYAVKSNAGVKLQYTYDRWSTDDWAWTARTFFTNGTLVFNETPQATHFIGISAFYEWR